MKQCHFCGYMNEEEQQLCSLCGKGLLQQVEKKDTITIQTETAQSKTNSKKKKYLTLSICCLIIAIIFIKIFSPSSQYISIVKSSAPSDYPQITCGQALQSFFKNSSWKYFKSEYDENIVEFFGENSSASKSLKIQFIVYKEEKSWDINRVWIDEEELAPFAGYLILLGIFSEYNS